MEKKLTVIRINPRASCLSGQYITTEL